VQLFSRRLLVSIMVLMLLSLSVSGVFAQDDDEDGELVDEAMSADAGVEVITGEVNYTVGFLTDFNQGAMNVVLVNQALYADRDFESPLPTTWQVLGEVTSDVYTSPFTYELYLPIEPRGPLRDVDYDEDEDEGVGIFSIIGYTNFRGKTLWDSELEYTTGFNSTQGSPEFEFRNDVIGGKMIIWAPDDEQGFPSGFGDDGLLFTGDEPVMDVPAGWSIVNLDTEPFSLDRSTIANVDLLEQDQSLQPADYTQLSYSEAFDALHEQMRNEYSFTELKGIDWDALYEEFAPRFAEAEANDDPEAYQFALRDFTWAIPDGHVGASLPLTNNAFFTETDGGLGLAVRELDDGRIIATFVQEGSPAAEAGVTVGTEITSINGEAPLERIDDVNVWSSPFSAEHSRRLQELRYITRFEVGEEVELGFVTEAGEEEVVTLEAVAERASWSFSSVNNGAAPDDALPITFEVLPSGYAYVQINSFSEYPELMFRLWEWIIDQLNAQNIPGLILDMRWNSGGYNLDAWLTGYFFQERVTIGNDANYYPDLGDFFIDPLQVDEVIPPEDGRYYGGPIALLTSPACASACEFFSYNMTINDRATVVGFYPSDGLGGNITPVFMPDDVYFQFTTGRALDAEGNIRLEGIGVAPDVVVPLTEETLLTDEDVVLQYAVDYLNRATTIPVTEGGEITLGEPVEGELVEGERIQYTFTTPADGFYDFIITSEDDTLDTVMYIYLADDLSSPALENDDAGDGVFTSSLTEIEAPGDLALVIEVAGFEDASSGPFTLTVSQSAGGDAEEEAAEETEDAAEETEEAEADEEDGESEEGEG